MKRGGKSKGGWYGMEEVIGNLNSEVRKIENRTMKGLILAAILIRRSMEDVSPKIPIDLGNLRASFFTVTSTGAGETKGGQFVGEDAGKLSTNHGAVIAEARGMIPGNSEPLVILGFTANYAIFVHENMEAKFKRPGSGPKFFEEALRRNHKEVLNIIASNVKIQ